MADIDPFVVGVVLDRWRVICADTAISPRQRVARLEEATTGLVEDAGALRLIARDVAARSDPEVLQATAKAQRERVAAAEAAAKARSEALARQIERRGLMAKAAAARASLRDSEQVAERLAKAQAPQRELVLARGAVEGDRRTLAEVEQALAALDAPPVPATEVAP